MKVDPAIFKAYDIRGIYGKNLDENVASIISKAFAAILKPETVIVGRDGRTSGPSLTQAVIDGLTSVGVNVMNVGTSLYRHVLLRLRNKTVTRNYGNCQPQP
jgi:phosphomannomutase